MLRKITQEKLDEILKQHELWLESDGKDGIRADLSFHDLRELKFPTLRELILVELTLQELTFQNQSIGIRITKSTSRKQSITRTTRKNCRIRTKIKTSKTRERKITTNWKCT